MSETKLYALTDEDAAAARTTLAYMARTQIDAEHEIKFQRAYAALRTPATVPATIPWEAIAAIVCYGEDAYLPGTKESALDAVADWAEANMPKQWFAPHA